MEYSAILLAGGKSSRMGKNKAELIYKGKTFREIQFDKLRELGISDIIVSGYGEGMVPDEKPDCGPMGGISTCLRLAKFDNCIVLPIDTPLVTGDILRALMTAHHGDVTVLSHGEELEPLIGIYSRSIIPVMEKLLTENRYALRRIFPQVEFTACEFNGDLRLIKNYNTPEDYAELIGG